MKIAVTGGAGFVGRYVVNQLKSDNHETISLDIVEAEDAIKTDMTILSQVRNALTQVKPDAVVHLAALAGSPGKGGGSESLKHPYEYFYNNANGTLTLYEACRELGIKRVLCMSSFSPYGKAPCPISEETPFNPNNPYGGSKACVEEIAKCYAIAYGIKTLIFRPPLICGEGQKEINVLREFVISALHDDPIEILGEGKHVREFIHPQDVATAFSAGIRYVFQMEKPYDIFILGSKPVSMKDLAQIVVDEVGKGSIIFKPATNQVFDQFTDHRKVKDILGWSATIDIREIVRKVVLDIKSQSFT
jgi:UDP-glucose 4-epimerase